MNDQKSFAPLGSRSRASKVIGWLVVIVPGSLWLAFIVVGRYLVFRWGGMGAHEALIRTAPLAVFVFLLVVSAVWRIGRT